jgi:hypothetical protein
VSRESKIAVLESILVRVQCRANEPRAPRLATVAEASARAEVAAVPAIEPVVAPVMRAPLVREERESLPPWPDPEPETGPQLIPIDDSAPQLIPIDEPPPSSPRLRDEMDGEPMEGAADASEETEEPITLPPVSGRQHVEGVSPERVVTLAPESEPPLPALDMDISAGGESATPPPAAPLALVPAPIEMVESAEPPAVQPDAPSVRLMVQPGPRAPGQAPPAPVAVEVRADAIVPPERAAASVAIFEGEAKRFAPKSIGELLDATLGLGR